MKLLLYLLQADILKVFIQNQLLLYYLHITFQLAIVPLLSLSVSLYFDFGGFSD